MKKNSNNQIPPPEADQCSKHGFGIWLLVIGIFLFSSCLTRKEQPSPPSIIAFVNGVSINEDDLRFRLNLEKSKFDEKTLKDPEKLLEFKKEILNRMIENRVVIDWGEKQGIVITEADRAHGLKRLKKGYTQQEFEWMLREKNIPFIKWRQMAEESLWVQKVLKETLYKSVRVSANEITSYYKRHQNDFKEDEKVRVRQIVTDSLEKAQKLEKLVLSRENFARLAIMHSISPDRSQGGDLGFFARGTHPKEFDEACFNLKIGEISPIIKTPYGYHIFKLIDRKPAGVQPLEEVLPLIQSELLQKQLVKRYKPWLKELMAQSQIQIIDDTLEKMEL